MEQFWPEIKHSKYGIPDWAVIIFLILSNLLLSSMEDQADKNTL